MAVVVSVFEVRGAQESILDPLPRSNNEPTPATADSVGNINNPGTNVANYWGGGWNGVTYNLTSVGSAGPSSESFYGTADQGGNLYEWIEYLFPDSAGTNALTLGGFYQSVSSGALRSGTYTEYASASTQDHIIGFRVATVPEPSTLPLIALGIVGLVLLRNVSALKYANARLGDGATLARSALNCRQ